MAKKDRHITAFREWFAVELGGARLLALLYERPGEAVTHAEVGAALGWDVWVAHRHLRLLREAMDPGSLLGRPGCAYQLTDVGLADCRRAIADRHSRKLAA